MGAVTAPVPGYGAKPTCVQAMAARALGQWACRPNAGDGTREAELE